MTVSSAPTAAPRGSALSMALRASVVLLFGLGFFALVASPVGPVRTLGLWAGLGLLAALAAALTLLPALLATAAAHRGALPERGLEARLEQLGRRLASASSARPRVVVAAYAVAAAVALAGLPRLGVESNALTYLAADHSVRTGTATLERAGAPA